jgi:S1-C subfamily serine protease
MPAELRFCRNCGFRLGTEFGGGEIAATGSAPLPAKKRRRISGMAWVFIGLLVFFVGAAAFTAIISPARRGNVGIVTVHNPVKSYVGVDGWETAENGVTFGSIDAPDGPADKAGLVGGDIITKFDGKEVRDEEVESVRDGETKTTRLTTVSIDEFRRLQKEFEKRPEGRGVFGYEEGDTERVQVPGMNVYGVRLDGVLSSRPADLAGIKKGDIIIEFDGIPIRTSDEFLMRVRRAVPYSTVKVVVIRNEEKLEIPVKMGKSG